MTSRRVDEDGDELKVHHYITIEPSHDGDLAVTACGDELEENGATLEGFHYIPPALRCRECKRIVDKLSTKYLSLSGSTAPDRSSLGG
jgi:hypothetical protein